MDSTGQQRTARKFREDLGCKYLYSTDSNYLVARCPNMTVLADFQSSTPNGYFNVLVVRTLYRHYVEINMYVVLLI